MVTTFSPPSKPKKKKAPMLPIVLGIACAVLLAGLFHFLNQANSQKGQANRLKEGVMKIAESAGSEAVTAEALDSPDSAAEAIDALSTAVAQRVSEAQTARAELDQQQIEATRIATEREALAEQLTDLRGQTDAVRRDLTERSSQLADLQKKYDDEVAKLRAQIVALTPPPPEEGEDAEAGEEGVAAIEDAEIAEVTEGAEGEPPSNDPPKAYALVVPEGGSQLFKTVRYDPASSQLTFLTVNDLKLVYREVPEEVYDRLLAAPVFDIYFRFKIMDGFESEPDDRELIRSIRR